MASNTITGQGEQGAAPPFTLADLHALGRLGFDSVTGITTLVEEMHRNIARLSLPLGTAPGGRAPGISGLVYAAVRGVTRGVGGAWNLAERALPASARKLDPRREAWIAALNGIWGGHLATSGNPLAITLSLRDHGLPLVLDRKALLATWGKRQRKLLILIHGLCMNDLQWRRQGHDHGRLLANAAGYTPLYLHYNSGRHISENGREFAALLERLFEAWPSPIEEIALLGHSMGGLVARSACHYAEAGDLAWRRKLRRIAFLGTPQHGAPLERAGNWFDNALALSPYFAPFTRLGGSRSAGIKDLRHGNLLDEDWAAAHDATTRDHRSILPLPSGVPCHAVAATRQHAPTGEIKRLRGDGLVPVASALGRHADAARCLDFAASDMALIFDCDHFDLLSNDAVGRKLLDWFGASAPV
jgi:pimeloyl-ACP methyl ester carboxylesterase